MDTDFHPVNQLTTLLGPTPTHPWEALIPQILLWSFRRFCIIKLSKTTDTPITEQIWDDHMELIRVYAPKGLDCVTTTWITDENIEYIHSSLRDYNIFFLNILTMMDSAYEHSDTVAEDIISKFLDVEMGEIIYTWIEPFKEFLIFPMNSECEDDFTDDHFASILMALTDYSKRYEESEESQAQEQAQEQDQAEEQPQEQPKEPPKFSPEILSFLNMSRQAYIPEPEVTTVREAMARRRTLKNMQVADARRKTRKRIYT